LSRSKLIKQLKEKNSRLSQSEIEKLIDLFSESIADALQKGRPVEIRGLGRWYCKKLKENFNARNPTTNELIYKPERVKVRFRPSKKLKKIINE
jgi:nucleoid DNA-binding protein